MGSCIAGTHGDWNVSVNLCFKIKCISKQRLVPRLYPIKKRDRLRPYHPKDFIGYVVPKVCWHALPSHQPRSKLNLRKTWWPVTGVIHEAQSVTSDLIRLQQTMLLKSTEGALTVVSHRHYNLQNDFPQPTCSVITSMTISFFQNGCMFPRARTFPVFLHRNWRNMVTVSLSVLSKMASDWPLGRGCGLLEIY